MENAYLYPQEPSKPNLKNLSWNGVNFDHSGNKYRNKSSIKIIQTSDIMIKIFSKNGAVEVTNSKLKLKVITLKTKLAPDPWQGKLAPDPWQGKSAPDLWQRKCFIKNEW